MSLLHGILLLFLIHFFVFSFVTTSFNTSLELVLYSSWVWGLCGFCPDFPSSYFPTAGGTARGLSCPSLFHLRTQLASMELLNIQCLNLAFYVTFSLLSSLYYLCFASLCVYLLTKVKTERSSPCAPSNITSLTPRPNYSFNALLIFWKSVHVLQPSVLQSVPRSTAHSLPAIIFSGSPSSNTHRHTCTPTPLGFTSHHLQQSTSNHPYLSSMIYCHSPINPSPGSLFPVFPVKTPWSSRSPFQKVFLICFRRRCVLHVGQEIKRCLVNINK